MLASTIVAINRLPESEKRSIFARMVPPELIQMFNLNPQLVDEKGNDLLQINAPSGSADAEIALYHQVGFEDPILYGHSVDNLHGQFHILLYVLNDPNSPRFNIDRLPDGTSTQLGSGVRNLDEELKAFEAGLSPGQVRKGLHMLGEAIDAYEKFIAGLGHEIYFAEPLYYHNAVIFEQYGFAYEIGRKLMERIQAGFSPGGDLLPLLDGSTPFRQPEAANSIRLRSWAIHDGILGRPFTEVTMYKHVGQLAGVTTCPGCCW
jgi:acetoin utilization protein AcuC